DGCGQPQGTAPTGKIPSTQLTILSNSRYFSIIHSYGQQVKLNSRGIYGNFRDSRLLEPNPGAY
ncbi:hypothetical protein J4G07_12550, partial [Candidatus Poribacteria bacterium]|nr:hypothetical protein [Candidatus Poribacteria bacterium]